MRGRRRRGQRREARDKDEPGTSRSLGRGGCGLPGRMWKPAKKIDVGTASVRVLPRTFRPLALALTLSLPSVHQVVDLKAELFKKAEEFDRQRQGGAAQRRPASAKPTVWSKPNKGVQERSQRDAVAQAGKTEADAQAALERGARMYDQLERGAVGMCAPCALPSRGRWPEWPDDAGGCPPPPCSVDGGAGGEPARGLYAQAHGAAAAAG